MSLIKNKNEAKDYSDTKKKSETIGRTKKMKIKEKQGDSEENSEVKIDMSIINGIIEDKYDELFFNRNKTVDEGLKLFFSNEQLSCLLLEIDDKYANEYVVKLIERNFEGKITILDGEILKNIKDEFRKGIYAILKNHLEVFEGEVVSIKIEEDITKDIEVILKTNKSSKTIRLDRRLKNGLSNVNIGDVVYIEPNSGFLKRLGRSENCINEYDLEGDKYVQLSKQPVNTKRKKDLNVNLFEIDFATNGYIEDIDDLTRIRTNEMVEEYLKCGTAVLLNSCIVVFLAKQFDSIKICELMRLHEEMPWVKIIFVGKLKENNFSELKEFARIEVNSLNKIDYLRLRHSNFNEFEEVVSDYIEKISIEVISDLINISDCKEVFKKYVENI